MCVPDPVGHLYSSAAQNDGNTADFLPIFLDSGGGFIDDLFLYCLPEADPDEMPEDGIMEQKRAGGSPGIQDSGRIPVRYIFSVPCRHRIIQLKIWSTLQ